MIFPGEWSLECEPNPALAGPCPSPLANVNQPQFIRDSFTHHVYKPLFSPEWRLLAFNQANN